jgi:AcrR family transcriptional regulator
MAESPVKSTKAAVLEAAMRLFLSQGFEATSMDQVRQAAGVSNGSLYHHYPTKNDLARALYAEALRDFHAAQLAVIAEGEVPAQVGVQGMVSAYIAWVVKHPERARVLHELRRTSAVALAEPEWGGLNAETFSRLREWVAGRVEAGELQPLPFSAWMALVFAPVLQLTPLWLKNPRPSVPPKLRAALVRAAWLAVAPE